MEVIDSSLPSTNKGYQVYNLYCSGNPLRPKFSTSIPLNSNSQFETPKNCLLTKSFLLEFEEVAGACQMKGHH